MKTGVISYVCHVNNDFFSSLNEVTEGGEVCVENLRITYKSIKICILTNINVITYLTSLWSVPVA